MFNNLSYISICCSKDKNLMSILDSSNGQVLSFYQSEIDKYLNRYIQTLIFLYLFINFYIFFIIVGQKLQQFLMINEALNLFIL